MLLLIDKRKSDSSTQELRPEYYSHAFLVERSRGFSHEVARVGGMSSRRWSSAKFSMVSFEHRIFFLIFSRNRLHVAYQCRRMLQFRVASLVYRLRVSGSTATLDICRASLPPVRPSVHTFELQPRENCKYLYNSVHAVPHDYMKLEQTIMFKDASFLKQKSIMLLQY